MKKKLCIALLSVLMLTACSTGGQSSGGSQIEASSGEQSTEVSTTPSSSVDPTPEYKALTLEEAQAQAKAMVKYINSDEYVEPQSYQYSTSQKEKDNDVRKYNKLTFTINRAQEKMSMYLYDRYGKDANGKDPNPILGRWLSKKEAGSYYHQEQTSTSKQYEVIAAADFEVALGTAKLSGEQSYKDSVGKGTIKAASYNLLDAFAKKDFSTVTGVTWKFKGNGEGKFEMVFDKITPNGDSTSQKLKHAFAFDNYNLTILNMSEKKVAENGDWLTEKSKHQTFDYKTWTIEIPPVDDTWTEISK